MINPIVKPNTNPRKKTMPKTTGAPITVKPSSHMSPVVLRMLSVRPCQASSPRFATVREFLARVERTLLT